MLQAGHWNTEFVARAVQRKPTTKPSRTVANAALPSARRFNVLNTAECYMNSAAEASVTKFALVAKLRQLQLLEAA